ncbi:MAG TPA: hypothetical protein VF953_03410 [Terriglobales bacterium]
MASYIEHRGIAGLFRASFLLYWRFLTPLALISASIFLPLFVSRDIGDWIDQKHSRYIDFAANVGINPVLTALADFVLISEISQACFGDDISPHRGFSRIAFGGTFRLYAVTWTMILLLILSLAVPISAFVVADALHLPDFQQNLVVAVAAIFAVAAAVVVFMTYFFSVPAIILERCAWWGAIKRGLKLGLTSFWKTLWYSSLFFLALGLAGNVALGLDHLFLTTSTFIHDSLEVVFFTPLGAIFQTLLYYNLRIERQEMTAETIVQLQTLQAV